jgi:ABC-type multidrug transport system ATPase subunit
MTEMFVKQSMAAALGVPSSATHSRPRDTRTTDSEFDRNVSQAPYSFTNMNALRSPSVRSEMRLHEVEETIDEYDEELDVPTLAGSSLDTSLNSASLASPSVEPESSEQCALIWSEVTYQVRQSSKWNRWNPFNVSSTSAHPDDRMNGDHCTSGTSAFSTLPLPHLSDYAPHPRHSLHSHPERVVSNKVRTVLNAVSGLVQSGQMLAVIGPSGVGKSSLLHILSGRPMRCASGQVQLTARIESVGKASHPPISFVPQTDVHMTHLTVEETLMYASRLKNQKRASDALRSAASTVSVATATAQSVDDRSSNVRSYSTCCSTCESHKTQSPTLDSSSVNVGTSDALPGDVSVSLPVGERTGTCTCSRSSSSGTVSNADSEPGAASTEHLLCHCGDCSGRKKFASSDQFHRHLVQQILHSLSLHSCAQTLVIKCSGGQVKRLSIAVELLSRPRIIIMDEPTTGLDFSSAFNCVRILRSLTRSSYSPPGNHRVQLTVRSSTN